MSEEGNESVELISSKENEENATSSDEDPQKALQPEPTAIRADKGRLWWLPAKVRALRRKKVVDRNGGAGQNDLKKELTLLPAVAYVVGSIIGSGIFITPSTILCRTGSFGLSLIVWVIGGAVALAGGLCYTELGLLIRKSGGDYSYIKETYSFRKKHRPLEVLGSLLSFLFIWASTCVIRSSSLAIISLTCARYLIQPFFIGCEIPLSAAKLLAISVLVFHGIVNCYSFKLASKIMTVITFLKILSVVFVALVGVVFMIIRRSFPDGFQHPFQTVPGLEPNVTSFALSLYSVLWAYNGWNVMSYAVEETKNLRRTLPLAMIIGIPIVIVCYLLVNVSFFAIISDDQILNSQAVGLPFGKDTMGTAGVVVMLLLVSLSTFGAANGSLYVGSRVIFVAAREGDLPDFLSGIGTTAKTPVPSIILQVFVSILMVSIGTIGQLIDGFTFISFVFYTLSIMAVLILRITHRKEPRFFKVWFIVPVALSLTLFCLFLLFAPLLSAPLPPLMALGFVALGIPVYFFLVMETPWKIRPKCIDKMSERISDAVNKILNTHSTRHKSEQSSL